MSNCSFIQSEEHHVVYVSNNRMVATSSNVKHAQNVWTHNWLNHSWSRCGRFAWSSVSILGSRTSTGFYEAFQINLINKSFDTVYMKVCNRKLKMKRSVDIRHTCNTNNIL